MCSGPNGTIGSFGLKQSQLWQLGPSPSSSLFFTQQQEKEKPFENNLSHVTLRVFLRLKFWSPPRPKMPDLAGPGLTHSGCASRLALLQPNLSLQLWLRAAASQPPAVRGSFLLPLDLSSIVRSESNLLPPCLKKQLLFLFLLSASLVILFHNSISS